MFHRNFHSLNTKLQSRFITLKLIASRQEVTKQCLFTSFNRTKALSHEIMHEPILTRGEIKVIDFQGRDKPERRDEREKGRESYEAFLPAITFPFLDKVLASRIT